MWLFINYNLQTYFDLIMTLSQHLSAAIFLNF